MNDVRLACSLQIAICGVEIGEFCCILIDARLKKAKLRDIKVAVVQVDRYCICFELFRALTGSPFTLRLKHAKVHFN